MNPVKIIQLPILSWMPDYIRLGSWTLGNIAQCARQQTRQGFWLLLHRETQNPSFPSQGNCWKSQNDVLMTCCQEKSCLQPALSVQIKTFSFTQPPVREKSLLKHCIQVAISVLRIQVYFIQFFLLTIVTSFPVIILFMPGTSMIVLDFPLKFAWFFPWKKSCISSEKSFILREKSSEK